MGKFFNGVRYFSNCSSDIYSILGSCLKWAFFCQVTTSIYNLILGKLYCDHYGTMRIQGNREYSCKLKFKEQSIIDRNPHQVHPLVSDFHGWYKLVGLLQKNVQYLFIPLRLLQNSPLLSQVLINIWSFEVKSYSLQDAMGFTINNLVHLIPSIFCIYYILGGSFLEAK